MFLRLGQGEGVFKLKAKKVILGSGRLRAGSIIAEEAGRFFPVLAMQPIRCNLRQAPGFGD